jgi:homoserine kinase type II
MVSADQVRAALRTSWHRSAEHCHQVASASETAWYVEVGGERFVAKVVPASRRAPFEAGLAAAEHLERASVLAGAPVRTADGALTIAVDGGRLALLRWVPGRPLDRDAPIDQQFWGDGLAAAHRGLVRFSHPGLVKFQRVRADAPHLDVEPWVRPAVTSAIAAVTRLCVTDQLTYGVLHGDPAPEEFRLDIDTGRIGLLGWGSGSGSAATGPLTYDLASAVMYAGGTSAAGELLDGYLSTGIIGADECEAALPTMLRFCWAVRADRCAARLSGGDRADEVLAGLAATRDGLEDGAQ